MASELLVNKLILLENKVFFNRSSDQLGNVPKEIAHLFIGDLARRFHRIHLI